MIYDVTKKTTCLIRFMKLKDTRVRRILRKLNYTWKKN